MNSDDTDVQIEQNLQCEVVDLLISVRVYDDFRVFQVALFMFVLSWLECVTVLNCRSFPGEQIIFRLSSLSSSNLVKGTLRWVKQEWSRTLANDLDSFSPRLEQSLGG